MQCIYQVNLIYCCNLFSVNSIYWFIVHLRFIILQQFYAFMHFMQ